VWYLAEQYQPGTNIGELRQATARLADAAAALNADGLNVRFAGASFVRSDESCFCRFESDSIDAVRTACQRAQFPTDRILPIDEIDASASGSSRKPLT
jgi:hypothetical protein